MGGTEVRTIGADISPGLTINFRPSWKQYQALEVLNDKKTRELLYGGAAGGGKSYLGCAWIIINCLQYAGTRWVIGRAHLKALKESTLLTFFQICAEWGLIRDGRNEYDYTYNGSQGIITFNNGSAVHLKDLFQYPTDPEFQKLGSTEYTGGFIDECGEVTEKAKMILMSRFRFRLDEFGLIPKLFMASNPNKGFLYQTFYKPWRDGNLAEDMVYIPALVQDNPYISPHYIDLLKRLDPISKERLLNGNWEYDDDPGRLMDYDDIMDLFTNAADSGLKYMSVDVARFGRDYSVICLWDGLICYKIMRYQKTSTTELADIIKRTARHEKVRWSHIIIDDDGVGGGVVDQVPGCKGFVNGSKPLQQRKREKDERPHNFADLKTQCYFRLAQHARRGSIRVKESRPEIKKLLIEDLEQVKLKNPDKDAPLRLVGKEEIKEMIGRSPDIGDALMMRMWFEVKPKDSLLF